MKGRSRAAKSQLQQATFLAWHTAAFAVSAYAGKLKPLSKYLQPDRPKRAQSAAEMIDALRQFQGRGAGMKITHRPN